MRAVPDFEENLLNIRVLTKLVASPAPTQLVPDDNLNILLQRYGRRPSTYRILGSVKNAQGLHKEAAEAWARVPGGDSMLLAVGRSLLAKGQGQEGYWYVDAAWKTRPSSSFRLWLVAIAYYQSGLMDQAIEKCREALKMGVWEDPLSKQTSPAACYALIGEALADQGKPDEAERQFQMALRIQVDGWTLYRLGLLKWEGFQRPLDAIPILKEAYQYKGPHQTATAYVLGEIYRSAGNLGEATLWLHRAVDALPENQHYREQLGEVLLQNGDVSSACNYLSPGSDQWHLGDCESPRGNGKP